MATPPLRAILIPLDGSAIGEQAIPVGAALARRAGTVLHLAMAHQPPSALLLSTEPPRVAAEVDREARTRAGAYLETVTDAARTTHGLSATAALLEGPPASALAEYAAAHRIGLVVMMTHGRGGFSRWWLGSVADRLLRRTPAPVLLLHPGKQAQPTEFHRILVALAGEQDDAVLEPALTLGALGPGASYVLARVVPPSVPIMSPLPAYPGRRRPDWAKQQELEARNALARLSARLRSRGIHVATEVMAAEGVAESLLDAARAHSADLIAVGTHGAGGVERLILGSVADKVIRRATRPVLVAPPLK